MDPISSSTDFFSPTFIETDEGYDDHTVYPLPSLRSPHTPTSLSSPNDLTAQGGHASNYLDGAIGSGYCGQSVVGNNPASSGLFPSTSPQKFRGSCIWEGGTRVSRLSTPFSPSDAGSKIQHNASDNREGRQSQELEFDTAGTFYGMNSELDSAANLERLLQQRGVDERAELAIALLRSLPPTTLSRIQTSFINPALHLDIIGCLPPEIARNILLYLEVEDLLKLSLVCKYYHRIINSDQTLWRCIYLRAGYRCDLEAVEWWSAQGTPLATAGGPSLTSPSIENGLNPPEVEDEEEDVRDEGMGEDEETDVTATVSRSTSSWKGKGKAIPSVTVDQDGDSQMDSNTSGLFDTSDVSITATIGSSSTDSPTAIGLPSSPRANTFARLNPSPLNRGSSSSSSSGGASPSIKPSMTSYISPLKPNNATKLASNSPSHITGVIQTGIKSGLPISPKEPTDPPSFGGGSGATGSAIARSSSPTQALGLSPMGIRKRKSLGSGLVPPSWATPTRSGNRPVSLTGFGATIQPQSNPDLTDGRSSSAGGSNRSVSVYAPLSKASTRQNSYGQESTTLDDTGFFSMSLEDSPSKRRTHNFDDDEDITLTRPASPSPSRTGLLPPTVDSSSSTKTFNNLSSGLVPRTPNNKSSTVFAAATGHSPMSVIPAREGPAISISARRSQNQQQQQQKRQSMRPTPIPMRRVSRSHQGNPGSYHRNRKPSGSSDRPGNPNVINQFPRASLSSSNNNSSASASFFVTNKDNRKGNAKQRVKVKQESWRMKPPPRTLDVAKVGSAHWDPETGLPRVNWKHMYSTRVKIDRNWRKGRYTVRTLSNPSATASSASLNPQATLLNSPQRVVPSATNPHGEGIYCIQFSPHPHSALLLSGSRDASIKAWDMDTGRCLRVYRCHKGSVLCLQFEEWRGGRDPATRWKRRNDPDMKDRPRETENNESSTPFDEDDEEGLLVSGSSDGDIILWELATGRRRAVLQGHTESVLGVKFVGELLASCSKDRTVKLWSTVTGALLNTLNGHRAAVNAVQIQGHRIVSASGDREIRIWSATSGECTRVIDGHDRGIATLQLTDSIIISGSSDCSLRIFDIETAECKGIMGGGTPTEVDLPADGTPKSGPVITFGSLGVLPNDRGVAGVNASMLFPRSHTELVRTLQFDDRWIVSGSYDETIKIWDRNSQELLVDLVHAHANRIFKIQFDLTKLVSCSQDQRILVWDFYHGGDVSFMLP